ncbi:hypothetical protein ES703_54508 [subsurface metagenome]
MTKKIYIGNLSYDSGEEKLREAFSEFGEVVSVNVITDRYTGQSRGFAFIEMGTEEEAKAAIAAMDGKELDGRQLKVNEALDRKQDGDRNRRKY